MIDFLVYKNNTSKEAGYSYATGSFVSNYNDNFVSIRTEHGVFSVPIYDVILLVENATDKVIEVYCAGQFEK